MKTLTTLLVFFLTLLLLQSCSSEEIEQLQIKPIPTTVDYTDAMMMRDSISRDGDSEPPVKPPVKP